MNQTISRATLASLAALVGCGDDLTSGEPPETPSITTERATVTGHVIDASGAAVAGATVMVRATGEKATSTADGAFTLDVPADTTLTVAATAPDMAPTLLPQFMIAPNKSTTFTVPLLTATHVTELNSTGAGNGTGGNPMGGAVAIMVKSISGASDTATGATVDITPSILGKVFYAPAQTGMPDPDPSLTAIEPGTTLVAWAVGVQPHVSILQLALDGVSQVDVPHSIDDVTWPGTFTVDANSLTIITLFTP